MRRGPFILLAFCVLVIGVASPAAAITGHNLQWGFEVGDQFHYTYSGDSTLGYSDYYVEIDSLPTIPTDVVDFSDAKLSLEHYSYYHEDGTEMFSVMPWNAMAIGNWSLVQELLTNLTSTEYEWIDTITEWGFSYTTTDSEWDPENGAVVVDTTTSAKFSKTDGVMNIYYVVKDPQVGLTKTGQITRDSIQSIPYLYIGIGAGIVAIIAIVVVVMKRR